jgi:hypothetical protein
MLSRFHGKKNNTCARCESALGLRSHEPDEKYWGIEGKLCKNCYVSVKSGIQEYDAYYISGYNRLPEEVEGRMSVLLFDERNEIIFTPKKKSYIPLRITADSLTDCKIINKNETTSLSRRIFTAGISKRKDKRYLQIGIQEGEQMSLLFDLDDKIDSAYNTISLIKASKDVEPDLEDKDQEDEGQQQIMSQKTLCNACESPNDMEAHFCSKCGNKLSVVEDSTASAPPPKHILESYNVEKEKACL